uniref:Uncharacterized protein n=1 Tax=Rhizophora mucronata TaxID=61149 RepID=A0A2P2IMA7_RHIMU
MLSLIIDHKPTGFSFSLGSGKLSLLSTYGY